MGPILQRSQWKSEIYKTRCDKMKKKWKIVAVVFSLLCVLQTGTVVPKAATTRDGSIYFRFTLKSAENGYTFGIQGRKTCGSTYSVVTQDNNSLGSGTPTNYIVIASDGRQICDNAIITDYKEHHMRYWSSSHEGIVHLRANTGSTLAGYNVSGTWKPDYYNYNRCGC